MNKSHYSIIIFLGITLSSCITVPAPKSGFMGDYSKLTGNKQGDELSFKDGIVKYATFDGVFINKPEISCLECNSIELAELQVALVSALEKEFSKKNKILKLNTTNALTLRTKIVNVETANVPLNIISSIILFPLSHGGASIEGEVINNNTQSVVAALSYAGKGNFITDTFSPLFKFGQAKDKIKTFSFEMAKLIN